MEANRADRRATPLTVEIAARVRQLRRSQGLTTYDIADGLNRRGLANWGRATVSKLENGVRESVTAEELVALAAVLKVSALELLYGEQGAEVQVTAFLAQRRMRQELGEVARTLERVR